MKRHENFGAKINNILKRHENLRSQNLIIFLKSAESLKIDFRSMSFSAFLKILENLAPILMVILDMALS
jgi:hypothetical protein